ncbi:MAG: PIN domain-containing protein [Chloroflexi bacterium]|nr:PIN domain-containing protein [Chloroflexota bacterium]
MDAARDFIELITEGKHTLFEPIEQEIAKQASELRARYNLALADAYQAAVALSTNCDVFLTNDVIFKRVTELNVIVVEEIEIEQASPSKQDESAD